MIERVWLKAYRSTEHSQSLDIQFVWIPTGKPVTLWGAAGKSYGGLNMRFAPREGTVITEVDEARKFRSGLDAARFEGPADETVEDAGADVGVPLVARIRAGGDLDEIEADDDATALGDRAEEHRRYMAAVQRRLGAPAASRQAADGPPGERAPESVGRTGPIQ